MFKRIEGNNIEADSEVKVIDAICKMMQGEKKR